MIFFRHGPLVLGVLDAVPVQTGVNGREAAQFVEHILGRFKLKPGDAEPPGDLGNNPPIWPGLALRGDGLAQALHAAFGVHAHAIGFAERRGGQHHVGKLSGLRSENIDQHQVLQRLKRALAMGAVRIGDERVLAIDHHRVNGFAAFVESRDFGDAFFRVDFSAVKIFKFLLAFGVVHRLEAGVIGRHRSGIARALNVVLPAHGIDARAFASEVAGH